MPEPPPRPPTRPIACPRCGHTRRLTVTRNTRLRCPQCRAEYRAPGLESAEAAPEPEAPAERDPTAPAPSRPPAVAPAGADGPRIVDVAGVTIRPAPPPEPGREPVAPAPESAESSPEAAAPRADENGKPPKVHGIAGRDRRPIRRLRP